MRFLSPSQLSQSTEDIMFGLHVKVSTTTTTTVFSHYAGQPALAAPGGFCWNKVLLPACPCWMLMATSTFESGERCYTIPQECYLHSLRTIPIPLKHCWHYVHFLTEIYGVGVLSVHLRAAGYSVKCCFSVSGYWDLKCKCSLVI